MDLYIRLIEDHGHACYLQTLVSDIDSHRFTADNQYKRETVLNLARYLTLRTTLCSLCRLKCLAIELSISRFLWYDMKFYRSLDQLHYDTAIDMAKRYKIDLWDVYMTHVDYLFTECK